MNSLRSDVNTSLSLSGGLRVYIPSSPNKYGLKGDELSDVTTFYTDKMELYAGIQPAGPYKEDTSNIPVVPRLF